MAEFVITKDNFENEVLKSSTPVLLDFWATWCGPCRMLSPIIEEIANDFDGKVKVGKVNVDEEQELALTFEIASIPTVVVIKDGRVINRAVGFMPKSKIENMLNDVL
ncbi:MAG: thioredoxin [Eubacterium sp.]|nr:thioredoxin [Eubacterium sp.]